MKSFSLIRTNTGLTTNVKMLISSTYSLFLESINSAPELNDTQYKKSQFKSTDFYDELVPALFGNGALDPNIAFSVLYNNDNDTMATDFGNQIDDMYLSGARVNEDEKNYPEEFEYFAPLYIFSENIPNYFIIFRVDGPGIVNLSSTNFNSEIIQNLKTVNLFDMTTTTPLGQWIETNFANNNDFPYSPFEMDFRNLQFSYWNGIDYVEGGYTKKGFFMNSTLEYENTYFDMESTIYNGYQSNKIIFPNIINFSFLFDDTPASPVTIATWSMNRYLGFYLDDLEYTQGFSPYIPPTLKSDVIIEEGNILTSVSSGYPFLDTYVFATASTYVELNGIFYQVQQVSINTQLLSIQKSQISNNVFEDEILPVYYDYYKIISNIDFTGSQSMLNSNIVTINTTTQSYVSQIFSINGSPWVLNDYDTADVWVVNINGVYHNIVSDGLGNFFINSDYAFSTSISQFNYWISAPDPNYFTSLNLIVGSSSAPITFPVYRCKFTDIKDFDYKVVDTGYAHYEYELQSTMNLTDESKLYLTNISSENNPPSLDDFTINGQFINIPAASEYTANYETFQIVSNSPTNIDLIPLWRKNPIRCKWGFQNSLSTYDYPYLLNNSFLSEDYNRAPNIFNPQPIRVERNLDYFYSINSSTSSYAFQSLHVEGYLPSGDLDTNFIFDLSSYLGITSSGTSVFVTQSTDYFSWFFGKNVQRESGSVIDSEQKWSYFNYSDNNVIPNTTLFRGLKFNLYEVSSVVTDSGTIETININPTDTYDDYKFSILLSSSTCSIIPINSASASVGIPTYSTNVLESTIINNWTLDNVYNNGVIVIYSDILYKCIAGTSSLISDPTINPGNSSDWEVYTTAYFAILPTPSTIFWSPSFSYTSGDFIYNSSEYYMYNASTSSTFWTPGYLYNTGDVVLYDNQVWISQTFSNSIQPTSALLWRDQFGNPNQFWNSSLTASIGWSLITLWSSNQTYSPTQYAIFNNILYTSTAVNQNAEPDLNPTSWEITYNFLPNPNYGYSSVNNPIILMNNRYYLFTGSASSMLQNGINIYINNIWKNVLVDISINDNTLPNISNIERDSLYGDLYSNLTAFNFMNAINDLTNLYGFSDYVNYIIINENQTFNIYNFNNLTGLPCFLSCNGPDAFSSRVSSLSVSESTLNSNTFNPNPQLLNGEISNLNALNNYNNISLGAQINRVSSDPLFVDNYTGLQNNIYNTMYRHSGYYMPIFTTIELFNHSDPTVMSPSDNYHFDTTLTDFGMVKELVISKVNTSGNVLQLRNNTNLKSIYPMIDEFGYTYTDLFMFKSNWDLSYYIECVPSVSVPSISVANASISISNTNLTNNSASF